FHKSYFEDKVANKTRFVKGKISYYKETTFLPLLPVQTTQNHISPDPTDPAALNSPSILLRLSNPLACAAASLTSGPPSLHVHRKGRLILQVIFFSILPDPHLCHRRVPSSAKTY